MCTRCRCARGGAGRLVRDEWTFAGTHTGPFPLPDGTQLPPTGKRLEIKGMELVGVHDGKIVIDNLYYGNIAVLEQLGPSRRA